MDLLFLFRLFIMFSACIMFDYVYVNPIVFVSNVNAANLG